MDAKLPAFLNGEFKPKDMTERLALASVCQVKNLHAAAARLFAAAFAAEPKLADDLKGGHRYNAACHAALAAAGKGEDAAGLDDKERSRLRKQALDWLRADLALGSKLGHGNKSARAVLSTWQTDSALAGVRDRLPLAKLPADERREWQHLWADVATWLGDDPLEPARAHAARREWSQAASGYERALKLEPTEDGESWFEYAAVLLLSGDRQGYTRACGRMVERCGQAPTLRAYHVARACTLAADSVADATRPGRLAQKELTSQATEFWSLTERGALYYRAGRFKDAVPLLEQSLRADAQPGRAVLNWLWLAMANQRLGRAEAARRWLGKAQAWLDQIGDRMPSRADEELGLHLHNWLEAQILRREAETLLRAKGATQTKGDIQH